MKKISLGTSDFKKLIDNNYYFVDKTLIIKEFLEDKGEIILIPRPRRFGKTLNLSIIKYFLENTDEDNSYLFRGLKIEQENSIMEKQGQYPLIYLTFKDEKHLSFDRFIESMKKQMSSLYKKHYYIYESIVFENDRKYYDRIINEECSNQDLEVSLFKLSEFLNKYHNKKVMILIDEYDTPIHQGHFKGYYDEIISFTRNFLSSALKDNINIEKALITGILRVARESIFSGLNNLKVYTLLNEEYSSFFGFTEDEVSDLLKYFQCNQKNSEFKKWYNGYIFGREVIYNPWSVLYYLSEKNRMFKPYWVNTSENAIIKSLLAEGNEEIKMGLETLYNGGTIETEINENVVMSELSKGEQNVWSFLLLSGYLKAVDMYLDEESYLFRYKLAIPNREIRTLYRSIIDTWFNEASIDNDFSKMMRAICHGDVKNFSKIFKRYVMDSFSYFDVSGKNPERVYHAFVLGMLVSVSNTHEVRSNRESGIGRYDVSLIPKDISKPGIIFEFKRYDEEDGETIEEVLDEALIQINEKKYDTELRSRGIKNIIKLAVVFNKKEAHIKRSSHD